MISKEKYEEYINNLLGISRLTNKTNSILINFSFKDDKCKNIVNFIQQDGTRDQLKDEMFLVDDGFYVNFLEKFILEYSKDMVVAFTDSIDLNEDGLYTYRIVTEDNDMLSIDNISFEFANHLINLVKKKNIVKSVNNENGFTNLADLLLLVGGVMISFSFLYLIIK